MCAGLNGFDRLSRRGQRQPDSLDRGSGFSRYRHPGRADCGSPHCRRDRFPRRAAHIDPGAHAH